MERLYGRWGEKGPEDSNQWIVHLADKIAACIY
jgi:hypothetical protein